MLLFLTSLFWGGNAVAGKLAVGHVSPMLLTAGRWGLACALLLAIGWRQFANDWPAIRPKLPLLAVLGMLGFTVFNVALYSALLFTTAINTSIEQAAIPMVIFVANFLLFRTRVATAQILGFLVSIVGVLLTASHGDPTSLLALDLNFGDGFRWSEPPVLHVMGREIPLAKYAEPRIRSQLAVVREHALAAARRLDLHGKAATAWRHAFEPIQLSDSPAIWLQMTPQSVSFAGMRANTRTLRGSIAVTGRTCSNAEDLVIGAKHISTGSPEAFFDGRIDDVRIYDRALSQSQIRDVRQAAIG